MKSRILMIDDDPNMITWGTILLALDGCCDVFSTQDGQSGLKILNQVGDIDLILLDMDLSGGSSWEVAAAIKNNDAYAHIPVVMITDRSQTPAEGQSAPWSETVDGYVRKPFVVKDFWQEIAPLLDKAKSNAACRPGQNYCARTDSEFASHVDLKQVGLADQAIVCPLCFGLHSEGARN